MKFSDVRGTHFHYKPPKITLPGEVDGRSLETNPDAVVAVEWLATCRDGNDVASPELPSSTSGTAWFPPRSSSTSRTLRPWRVKKHAFGAPSGTPLVFFWRSFCPGKQILKHAPKNLSMTHRFVAVSVKWNIWKYTYKGYIVRWKYAYKGDIIRSFVCKIRRIVRVVSSS